MTGIPPWRCLLVRTWPEKREPDYHVVADGHWLVFDVSLGVLYTLTGEQFSGEFKPAASPAARQPGRGPARGPRQLELHHPSGPARRHDTPE